MDDTAQISTQTTPMSHLRNLLSAIREQRRKKMLLQEHVTRMEEELGKLELYQQLQSLRGQLNDVSTSLAISEEDARKAAAMVYQETGLKTPLPGVTVKIFDVVTVTDHKAALSWATQNIPDAVTLNEKKFAAAIKPLQLEFARVTQEPRGQIASNLDKE